MKKLLLLFTLIAILCAISYRLVFDKNGIREVFLIKKKIASSIDKNNSIRKQNDALLAGIYELRKGKEAIEEEARSELGMVKQGEVFYRAVNVARENK